MDRDETICEESCALLVTETLKKFFRTVCVIDLENLSYERLVAPEYFDALSSGITNYDRIIGIFVEQCIFKNQRKEAYEYFNIRTMSQRLAGKESIKCDFKTFKLGWIRAYLMPAKKNRNGEITKVLYCSQDVNDEKNKERQNIELQNILCRNYACCYYVILDTNTAIPYKVTDSIQNEYGIIPMMPMQFDKMSKMYIDKAVVAEDRDSLYEISNISWLERNLDYTNIVERTFRVYDKDSYKYWQVRIAKTNDCEHFSIILGFGDVDIQMKEELSQKRALELAYEEAIQLRQGLLSDNIYLFNINLTKDLIDEDIICYSDNGEISLLKAVGLEAPCSFNEFAKRSTKLLAQEYDEAYKKIENCRVLLDAYYCGKESVSVIYGMYTADRKSIKVVQQTCVFSKVQDTGDIICTCFAKDITKDFEKNAILAREHKQYRDALVAQAEFEYEFDLSEGILTEAFVTKKGIDVLKTIGIKPPIAYNIYTKLRRKTFREKTLGKQNEKYWTCDGLKQAYNEGKRNVEFEFYSGFEDRYYRISFLLSRQSDDDNIRAIVIGRDITEERKKDELYRRRLAAALETTKRANYAKTTFLSQISHDIRTPLNGIIGLIEISRRHPNDIAMLEKNREKAMIAAKHLLSLINDVLEISKLDAENIKIVYEAFDIRELIKEIMTITEMRAIESNIKLIYESKSSDFKVPYVYGSPLQLRQIYLNIFGNAIKYNKPGGSVTGKVEVLSIDQSRVIYRYTISDTGIGMSKQFMQKIFEPFTQEHSDGTSIYQGTGLGMTIAKKLIDKMNGTIQIESEVGVGSKFIITIPFDIAHESDLPKPVEVIENNDISGTKVLLVEDNELNTEIATCLLEDAGAKVTSVNNGERAVEVFSNTPEGTFDIILMDVMMPVMNGYDATRTIRSLLRPDAKTIPIFAMTANAFAEDKAKAKEAGMNEHLSKPLDYKTMLQKIAKYI